MSSGPARGQSVRQRKETNREHDRNADRREDAEGGRRLWVPETPARSSGAWLAFGRRGQRGKVSDRAGSVRACCGVVVLLVAAAIPGVARSPASLGAGEGDRDSSSSPSANGA